MSDLSFGWIEMVFSFGVVLALLLVDWLLLKRDQRRAGDDAQKRDPGRRR